MAETEKVEKRGWLKKQGGLVKNWQQRWFVLRGLKLQYFTKDDESKLMGTIDLTGNKLIEIPYSRDEPDRWLFEIVQGRGGRMTTTHETYPLWASNEQERSDWLSALRRCVYKDKGGGVFGRPLQETMAYDAKTYNCKVPHIVLQCVELIKKEGKEAEGIFRLSGRLSQVKELRRRYDEGERPDLENEVVDIHTVASLLKLFFRELPEPVIPFEFFEHFLSLATSFKFSSKHEDTFANLKSLVKQIPKENYNLLDYLTAFLNEISSYQEVNKMTEKNISLIFGTNILRGEDNSPEFFMATQNLTTHIVLALVKWHDSVFNDEMAESDKIAVGAEDFEQLVSISDEPSDENTDILSSNENQSQGIAELADVDFSAVNDQVFSENRNTKPKIPPPIPSRSIDTLNSKNVGLNDSVDKVISSQQQLVNIDENTVATSTIITNKPTPSPRYNPEEVVKRRISNSKRNTRPTPLITDQQGTGEQGESDKISFIKVDREHSGFQSYIDSPLDQRISLNIGELPSTTEDLQALVLSMKIQMKQLRKENYGLQNTIDLMIDSHKKEIDEFAKKMYHEREAKDNALLKILTLNDQLIAYQSTYGPLQQ